MKQAYFRSQAARSRIQTPEKIQRRLMRPHPKRVYPNP
jgi:hypothetical protein